MKWLNPKEKPFSTYGLPFFDKEQIYRRFPKDLSKPLPNGVELLSEHPAGGQVRFHAKMRELQIRVKLHEKIYMSHMPPTGHSGFDIYLKRPGIDNEFRFMNAAFPWTEDEYSFTLLSVPEPVDCEVLIHLPLYSNLDSFTLGFDNDAKITEGISLPEGKIVVYGGSIDQGGCASRPGMAYTNILSRWMNREFVNLGFSGAGKAEEEVALAIREIDDISMYIINTAGNCPNAEWLAERMPRFLEILRERYPDVPILIWQHAEYNRLCLDPDDKKRFYDKLAVEESVYQARLASGDRNIYIARMDYTEEFMGHAIAEEVTVDGVHPTDLGFLMTAKKLYPILTELLQ